MNFNLSVINPSSEPWIDLWLTKIGKTCLPYPPAIVVGAPTMPKLSISSARNSLCLSMEILTKLSKVSEDLRNNVEKLSSSEWKKKTIKIGHLKENLTKLINSIDVEKIHQKVNKRKLKRLKEKQRKLDKVKRKQEELEEQKKLEKQIDGWLKFKREEAERTKAEENLAKDIDCVLSEVNKKKSDVKKNLSLICALIKLRNVRDSLHVQRGEKTSLEDKQAFTATTEKLLKIWENAQKNYTNEEHMLKTMLEKNADENKKHLELLKEKQAISEWEKILFGKPYEISPTNASLWALTAAERDLETFIAIRKSWDTFLVQNGGSSIPVGTVVPPNEPRESWGKYLT